LPKVDIITQNVDGLHQRAGSKNVIEIHGNIHHTKCSNENIQITGYSEDESPPRCPNCQAYLRPDVVWFGESLPYDMLERAMELCSKCDILFSIGTSGMVYPAASLPFLALNNGAIVVEINTVSTALSNLATYTIQGQSGEVLPVLFEAAWPEG
jgi:NAD-dependent deacetylase